MQVIGYAKDKESVESVEDVIICPNCRKSRSIDDYDDFFDGDNYGNEFRLRPDYTYESKNRLMKGHYDVGDDFIHKGDGVISRRRNRGIDRYWH